MDRVTSTVSSQYGCFTSFSGRYVAKSWTLDLVKIIVDRSLGDASEKYRHSSNCGFDLGKPGLCLIGITLSLHIFDFLLYISILYSLCVITLFVSNKILLHKVEILST